MISYTTYGAPQPTTYQDYLISYNTTYSSTAQQTFAGITYSSNATLVYSTTHTDSSVIQTISSASNENTNNHTETPGGANDGQTASNLAIQSHATVYKTGLYTSSSGTNPTNTTAGVTLFGYETSEGFNTNTFYLTSEGYFYTGTGSGMVIGTYTSYNFASTHESFDGTNASVTAQNETHVHYPYHPPADYDSVYVTNFVVTNTPATSVLRFLALTQQTTIATNRTIYTTTDATSGTHTITSYYSYVPVTTTTGSRTVFMPSTASVMSGTSTITYFANNLTTQQHVCLCYSTNSVTYNITTTDSIVASPPAWLPVNTDTVYVTQDSPSTYGSFLVNTNTPFIAGVGEFTASDTNNHPLTQVITVNTWTNNSLGSTSLTVPIYVITGQNTSTIYQREVLLQLNTAAIVGVGYFGKSSDFSTNLGATHLGPIVVSPHTATALSVLQMVSVPPVSTLTIGTNTYEVYTSQYIQQTSSTDNSTYSVSIDAAAGTTLSFFNVNQLGNFYTSYDSNYNSALKSLSVSTAAVPATVSDTDGTYTLFTVLAHDTASILAYYSQLFGDSSSAVNAYTTQYTSKASVISTTVSGGNLITSVYQGIYPSFQAERLSDFDPYALYYTTVPSPGGPITITPYTTTPYLYNTIQTNTVTTTWVTYKPITFADWSLKTTISTSYSHSDSSSDTVLTMAETSSVLHIEQGTFVAINSTQFQMTTMGTSPYVAWAPLAYPGLCKINDANTNDGAYAAFTVSYATSLTTTSTNGTTTISTVTSNIANIATSLAAFPNISITPQMWYGKGTGNSYSYTAEYTTSTSTKTGTDTSTATTSILATSYNTNSNSTIIFSLNSSSLFLSGTLLTSSSSYSSGTLGMEQAYTPNAVGCYSDTINFVSASPAIANALATIYNKTSASIVSSYTSYTYMSNGVNIMSFNLPTMSQGVLGITTGQMSITKGAGGWIETTEGINAGNTVFLTAPQVITLTAGAFLAANSLSIFVAQANSFTTFNGATFNNTPNVFSGATYNNEVMPITTQYFAFN